jgi:hypothetical protein
MNNTRIAYKLVKLRKDGSIGPLFINASLRISIGEWLKAEAHKRKGFAFRPGWHCTKTADAPHLKEMLKSGEVRQWWKVEISDFVEKMRPEAQGGLWYLAQNIRFLEPVSER